jgi:hypothetical protein
LLGLGFLGLGLLGLGFLGIGIVLAVPAHAQRVQSPRPPTPPPAPRRLPPDGDEPTILLGESVAQAALQNRDAIERAIAFLAASSERNGAFRLADADNPAPIAVTALAVLALLAHGDVCGRGARGEIVERGITFLMDQQVRSPRDRRFGYIGSEVDKYSKMHGHGFATLALAECYGMLGAGTRIHQHQLRDALDGAVQCIVNAQEQDSGGWYYEPIPQGHEGSITICVVQALRAARNAGVNVDSQVIERAVEYVRRSQKPDGSFRYALGDERSTPALTAAAVATLNATGEYDSQAILRAMKYLDLAEGHRLRDSPFYPAGSRLFPYYEMLYLAQALFQHRDLERFQTWYPGESGRLRARQRGDGSWESQRYGAVYATACTLLVLQLPSQYLPVFQR